MAKAPYVSPYTNPVCPYCCGNMKRNGKTRNGKQRYRCSYGCFNETENSVSPNSNVRTGYGTTKRFKLTKLAVSLRTSSVSNTLRATSKSNICKLKERCDRTDGLESSTRRLPSGQQSKLPHFPN